MKVKSKRKVPEIIIRQGKPTAVILDIDDYREILERLDDTEDIKELMEMKKTKLKFRKLDEFLKEHRTRA